MKLNLNQPILDLEDNAIPKSIDNRGVELINIVLSEARKLLPDDNNKSAIALKDAVDERLGSDDQTYKNVIATALMVPERDEKPEDKLKNYEWLKQIYASDSPDFDKTTAKALYDKVQKYSGNVLVIGRCHELLVGSFDKEEVEDEKPKPSPKKMKKK